MILSIDRKSARQRRHLRVRKKTRGTSQRPRLCVFRSLKHIQVQLIDDDKGVSLMTLSTLSPDVKSRVKSGGNMEAAKAVGEAIASKAQAAGIKKVVFDRGGYLYHGRVQALAEAARGAGLEF